MKTDLFQSCGHCWVFQTCWHIECSTFIASSFRIWNSSTGIPSPPVALFVEMLPKAHLTSHSKMPGSRWVITPSWLSGSEEIFCIVLQHQTFTSFIYNWALFSLWLSLFILSGVIFPLFFSSILGTYWPGKFIFQCHIFLPFHTVHGVLKERMLKWFAIPFSSGPHFVRTLHHDSSVLCGPTQHGS